FFRGDAARGSGEVLQQFHGQTPRSHEVAGRRRTVCRHDGCRTRQRRAGHDHSRPMRKPHETHPEPALTFAGPDNLANITVILVEPATAGNIGSTARAMKTMGLSDLVVVNGVKFKDSQQATMMGHGAGDMLTRAREIPTWEA